MPIYEYYCPDNHRIYQFYAKTLAQGRTTPKCPDNPKYRMEKILSSFAVGGAAGKDEGSDLGTGGNAAAPAEDSRMDAAMAAMEREFSHVDENDPKAMGRMMRRMAELGGEKIDGEMEEMVRKLEEGADPDSLEDRMGADPGESGLDEGPDAAEDLNEGGAAPGPARGANPGRRPAGQPTRDPKLYDYE